MPACWRQLGLVLGLAASAGPSVLARDNTHPEWPCIQRKVPTLTSSQMWDGPVVDDLVAWRDDPDIKKVLPMLVSRRLPVEEAAAAVQRFTESIAAEARDEKLKLLFAAVLATVNVERSAVIGGIERFSQRQKARAVELERQGIALKALRDKTTGTDAAAKAEIAQAEERYNWDSRVFGERQQSIPIACEIPVLIEQRVFELAREIRSHMKD